MTNKEVVNKNIEYTFDFIKEIIATPSLAEQLPDKCEIDFVEKDFSDLTEKKLKTRKLIKVNHTFEVIKPLTTSRK